MSMDEGISDWRAICQDRATGCGVCHTAIGTKTSKNGGLMMLEAIVPWTLAISGIWSPW